MKNFGLTFGWIAGLTVAALLCTFSFGLKKGIDLSGGTILVYQVKQGAKTDSDTMNALINALKRRLNPEGLEDIPIRRVGNNRVEIILAQATPEEVERYKRKVTDVGSLEFRILANYKHDQAAINRIDRATSADQRFKQPPPGYAWVHLGEVISGGKDPSGKEIRGAAAPVILNSTQIRLPGRSLLRDHYKSNETKGAENKGSRIVLRGRARTGESDVTRAFEIAGNTDDTITLTQPHGFASLSYYALEYNPSEIVETGQQAPQDPVIRDWDRGNGVVERYILVVEDRQNVTGEYLARVYPTQDERVQPAVGFVFNARGARKFGQLTGGHLPEEGGTFKYRLAVILDGWVRSAPAINSEIRDSGIIEGVPAAEIPLLIEILQSGSLPASIDQTPLLEEKVGPTLGSDTIAKGLQAIAISMVVVPLFMIVYYHFAGRVAVGALVINMILLVASMAVTGSSFTLPGLAGLALTIGMAVDANVLIFERMREEKERGAGLAQQIRNGFDRAWVTIIDSHITIFLSGAVLWAVGTEEIKGFALTLIIGMVWNLFTAVYVSRVVFEYCYSRGWIKQLTMMKFLGKTSIDFIGPRRYFMAGSALLIALGLAVFAAKGKSMYNIDFTGGTLVSVRLNPDAEVNGRALRAMTPGQRSEYVRDTAGRVLPDVTVEALVLNERENAFRFNVRTTADQVQQVQDVVVKAFGPTLDAVRMTVAGPAPIPAAAAPTTSATAAAKTVAPPVLESRFAGGNRFDLTFSRPIDRDTVRDLLLRTLQMAGVANPTTRFEILSPTGANRGIYRLTINTDLDPKQVQGYLAGIKSQLRDSPALLFDRLENFGGAVAGETRNLAIVAIIGSWLIIIAYLWFRFKSWGYGVGAVIALIHDVLITLGAVAISPYKIDLPMVAGFLTLIGFSVNDTIVIFDRIREIKGKTPHLTGEIINAAINQTLSRTFLTSLTAWLVVVIFYLFGGEGLRGFSFSLVIGFLSGTYSTIYIAAPILIEWLGREDLGHAKDSKEDLARTKDKRPVTSKEV